METKAEVRCHSNGRADRRRKPKTPRMNRIILLLIPIAALAANSPSRRLGQGAPADTPAQAWAASVEAEANQKYDEALNDVRIFQQSGGDAFLATERLAWLSYLNKDYVRAEQYYGDVSRSIPTAINPLLGLLNTALAQNDPRKIERAAQSLLRVEPSNYRAQMALAQVHLTSRDFQRAASEFRRVLLYYPDDLDATSGLAWSVFYLGAKHDALALFRRILTVRPDYAFAQRGVELASLK
jgi:tetratricopeptide (TPR) repeat protein